MLAPNDTTADALLPAALLDAPVAGSNLAAGDDGAATLRDQLAGDRPTLLAAVRHFGCIFCREMVKDLRTAAEVADRGAERRYPKVVFVHMAAPEAGARFFGKLWPAAPAISDPDRRLYDALGSRRGGWWQMFRPVVWLHGWRALRKGHRVGRPIGDPWRMPVLMLVEPTPAGDAAMRPAHAFAHAGSRPAYDRLCDEACSMD